MATPDAARAGDGSPFAPAPPRPLLERAVPVSAELRGYRRKAPRDLLAGLSVAAVALPSAMAYAELAGIPAVHGLYALLAPVVAYALLGSSRHLSIGPEGSLCAMAGAAILGLTVAGSGEAAAYGASLALLAGGCFCLALALRLGWIADYLSRPVLVGYLHGVAAVIVVAQLGKLLGLQIEQTDPVPQIAEVVRELGDASGVTLAVSAVSLGVILSARRLAPRFPAALVVVAGAVVASGALDLAGHGVTVIGDIPPGLPQLELPAVTWSELTTLAPAGAALCIFGFADGILTARSFADRRGDRVGVRQEMRALAAANAAAGLTQGLPVGASGSRTAMSAAAGARTQIAGVVCAAAILLTLLFLTGPLADLPKAVLGAAIVVAAIGLVDLQAWRSLAAVDRVELSIAGVTAAGVVVIGVLEAVSFAIALTIVDAVRRSARPGDAVLGYEPSLGRWADVVEHPQARVEPGVVVYRLEARLFFANTGYVRERIEAAIRGASTRTTALVLDCEAITEIDVTGIEMLTELCGRLRENGVALILGRVRGAFRRRLVDAAALDVLGAENVHPTVRSAVAAAVTRESPPREEARA